MRYKPSIFIETNSFFQKDENNVKERENAVNRGQRQKSLHL